MSVHSCVKNRKIIAPGQNLPLELINQELLIMEQGAFYRPAHGEESFNECVLHLDFTSECKLEVRIRFPTKVGLSLCSTHICFPIKDFLIQERRNCFEDVDSFCSCFERETKEKLFKFS